MTPADAAYLVGLRRRIGALIREGRKRLEELFVAEGMEAMSFWDAHATYVKPWMVPSPATRPIRYRLKEVAKAIVDLRTQQLMMEGRVALNSDDLLLVWGQIYRQTTTATGRRDDAHVVRSSPRSEPGINWDPFDELEAVFR